MDVQWREARSIELRACPVYARRLNWSETARARTGDTPIAPILLAIRDNKWPISGIIERDNRDEQGTVMELTNKTEKGGGQLAAAHVFVRYG